MNAKKIYEENKELLKGTDEEINKALFNILMTLSSTVKAAACTGFIEEMTLELKKQNGVWNEIRELAINDGLDIIAKDGFKAFWLKEIDGLKYFM